MTDPLGGATCIYLLLTPVCCITHVIYHILDLQKYVYKSIEGWKAWNFFSLVRKKCFIIEYYKLVDVPSLYVAVLILYTWHIKFFYRANGSDKGILALQWFRDENI